MVFKRGGSMATEYAVSDESLIAASILGSVAVKQRLLSQVCQLKQVADVLIDAYRAGRKLLIFGNGGSACDAQHIAGEFVGRFGLDRRPLPAEALTANMCVLTAIGNDFGFDQVFARQVAASGNRGDVALGISTSGNSANVVEGLRTARQLQLITIGLTGQDGGQVKSEVKYWVAVPSQETPRVQEAHILIGHIWSELVEAALFSESVKTSRDHLEPTTHALRLNGHGDGLAVLHEAHDTVSQPSLHQEHKNGPVCEVQRA
jgi:D-sedoheptulose 7-phosphate isomerase